MTTIQQERVILVSPDRNGRVEWFWPHGADLVRVSSDLKTEYYSVEEAHELFSRFLSTGWH